MNKEIKMYCLTYPKPSQRPEAWWLLAMLLIGWFSLGSCSQSTQLFQTPDVNSRSLTISDLQLSKDAILRAGDKITISIWGHEDLSVGSINSVYNSNEETGKWILLDDRGMVNLPKLGRVELVGLNVKEAAYRLEERYSEFIKNPIINVKVLNQYVTVLGEVNHPGKFSLDNEKTSLVQLVGEAGGFAEYANTEEIVLLRQVNGQQQKILIDLADPLIATAGLLNLQADDLLYVPATKTKNIHQNLQKTAPAAGILTAVAVLISVLLAN